MKEIKKTVGKGEKKTSEAEWDQATNIDPNLLRIFEQELFYDCSFLVVKSGDSKVSKYILILTCGYDNLLSKPNLLQSKPNLLVDTNSYR
jgi:hypothetical protein